MSNLERFSWYFDKIKLNRIKAGLSFVVESSDDDVEFVESISLVR